jgi:lipopolysaccharide biosynthesis glycosyltransferase
MFSMLHNYTGTSDIHAYVLTGEDFSEKNLLLLNSLSKRFDNFKVKIINVKSAYNDVAIHLKHLSKAALYRLMIPRIADSLPNCSREKGIYIDSDLIVVGNIEELFNIDVKGYYIAGVPDWVQYWDTTYKDKIGIPSMDRYINSGVLLFNLKEINNSNGLKELLEKTGDGNNFPFADQDAINIVLYNRIKLLPLKYNVITKNIFSRDVGFYNLYGEKNIIEAQENPFILHYITNIKPWLYRDITLSDKWWKYVKMQDKNIYCEYIKPFLKSHRLQFFEWVKDRVKYFLKRHGIYQPLKSLKDLIVGGK